ncbi:MAG TPA: BON domain-containing protein [Candidatus Dormibacteraeota bacterium]
MKTDKDLQSDVMAELRWDPAVDAADIGVSVERGAVTLGGHVKSYAEKIAAERAAKRVFGIKAVADEIEVRVPGTALRDDSAIAEAVADALSWNAMVPTDSVKAVVSNGWVTFEGEVEWPYQRAAAERAVREIKWIRGISNRVTVRPRVTPRDVEKKILQAFHRSADVDARGIRIETTGGTVILRGQVRSWSEVEAAKRAAWAAPGVSTVINELVVSAESPVMAEVLG